MNIYLPHIQFVEKLRKLGVYAKASHHVELSNDFSSEIERIEFDYLFRFASFQKDTNFSRCDGRNDMLQVISVGR